MAGKEPSNPTLSRQCMQTRESPPATIFTFSLISLFLAADFGLGLQALLHDFLLVPLLLVTTLPVTAGPHPKILFSRG